MAEQIDIKQLVVLQAYKKQFKTGSYGWFGKVLDPATGKTYQIVGAVEIKKK